MTWLKAMDKLTSAKPMRFYDSVTGKHLFSAPVGRSLKAFLDESTLHGWPSFRDAEVNWWVQVRSCTCVFLCLCVGFVWSFVCFDESTLHGWPSFRAEVNWWVVFVCLCFMRLFVCLSLGLFACLSLCLFVCLSVCLLSRQINATLTNVKTCLLMIRKRRDNVRTLAGTTGEMVSVDGTHLGHNIPDNFPGTQHPRNRYCINLISVSGNAAKGADIVVKPPTTTTPKTTRPDMTPTTLYVGAGCYWHVQRVMVSCEREVLLRDANHITSLTGFAGGTKAAADNKVCYHNPEHIGEFFYFVIRTGGFSG
jgi:peptide methionine sulfoxide reductase MsrB